MDDEDIQVEIEQEAPAKDETEVVEKVEQPRGEDGRFVKTEKDPDPIADLEKQYKELETKAEQDRQAREQAERARHDAERRAKAAAEDAQKARTEAVDRESETISAGLSAAESEASSAEAEYARCLESADWAGAAKAQRRGMEAVADIKRLKEAQAHNEYAKTRNASGEAQPRSSDSDPIEAFINTRSQPTATWLRAHKEYLTDARKNSKLSAAHHDAMGEGIDVDTPAYFQHVEKFLGMTEDRPEAKPNGASRRKGAPPAAPVTQSGGGVSGSSSNVVNLTKAEAAAATDGSIVWNWDDPNKKFKKGDPVGIQEYARRKQAMQRQGLYDKSHVES